MPATYLNTSVNDDTYRPDQWYLDGYLTPGGNAYGANVDAASVDYTGAGVVFANTDAELDGSHPDLLISYQESGTGITTNDHGTRTSGIVNAQNNSDGIVGVAYDATFRFYDTIAFNNSTDIDTLIADEVDVISESFGPSSGNNHNLVGAQTARFPHLQTMSEDGRDGLGILYFTGAGNEHSNDFGTQLLGEQTWRGSIVVGATTDAGVHFSISDVGANLFVAAPGAGIKTTDIYDGVYGSNDFATVSGTSFATPIAAGVGALILEANPGLGYRDVQNILALSSRKIDDSHASWQENGAANWNGGGNYVSDFYGFGLIDAHAAVRLAESWDLTTVGSFANEDSLPYSVNLGGVTSLPESTTRTYNVVVSGESDFRIEWVELDIDISHTHPGDLVIKIISPSGVEHLLLDTPANGTASADDVTGVRISKGSWGENPNGTWTIEVTDNGSGGTGGVVNSLDLKFYGVDGTTSDSTYFYNDDLSEFITGTRDDLVDTSGTDTINAAMVTSDTTLYLYASQTSTIDGESIVNSASTEIENAWLGIGNDTVYGGGVANVIHGGKGNDTLNGAGGADTLYGEAGNDILTDGGDASADTLYGGTGDDIYAISTSTDTVVENASEGTDTEIAGYTNHTLSANVENGNLGVTGNLYGNSLGNTLGGTTGADGLYGGTGNDTLAGGTGNDTLDGQAGADTMIGGAGDDAYVVDDAGDSVVEGAGDANDSVYSLVSSHTFASNVDAGYIGLTGGATLRGNAANNTLIGNSGNDTIDGGDGADVLYAGAGNDIFKFVAGEAHGDYLSDFSQGNDVLNFDDYDAGTRTFSQLTGTTYRIADSTHSETITFASAVTLTGSDWAFI